MYKILDSIRLVHMIVQYTWQYRFSSNECTIYLTVYVSSNECTIFLTVYVQIKWVYNILDGICLVQLSVQYTWQYRFSSNECTINLTVYV